eukprot:482857-Hanusia_phi.AAC.1
MIGAPGPGRGARRAAGLYRPVPRRPRYPGPPGSDGHGSSLCDLVVRHGHRAYTPRLGVYRTAYRTILPPWH